MSNNSELSSNRSGKRSADPAERLRSGKSSEKSTRVSHACELCREKRARCNGERPTCQRCAKLGVECEYGLAKNDRRRKEIEDLQHLVADYEDLVESMAPGLDGNTREKFAALRQGPQRSTSPSRLEYTHTSVPYEISRATSLLQKSPPDLIQGGDSSSSISGSTGLSSTSRSLLPPQSQGISPFAPFSSPDQSSSEHRKQSSAISQLSTPSLTNSVMDWQKGFLSTATEATVPPRDVTERAVKAFLVGSSMLFEFFEKDEIDEIFRTVYDTPPSSGRTIALCQLCVTAAVGCQYDWDQFPDDTAKSYLAVAKLYVEEIVESHELSAMRVMALLAMYFSFEKRISSLVYVNSGLSIARIQELDRMAVTAQTRKWKRTWCSLIFLSNWISATVGRHPDQAFCTFHPTMLESGPVGTSMADVVQLEMCKVAQLTGLVLRDVYHATSVDMNVINMYKAELESWLFGLPAFMRIDSLLASGGDEVPRRPIFLVHILYLGTMTLIYRRVLSEFADRPQSPITSSTMDDVKHHLDACLWASRQVSRILNLAMQNGAVFRKCWMFIHGAYCANTILLYFAANKLVQNPASESVGEDIAASEQCIRTLEYCAIADESALQFLKHVRPLHVALNQMHMVSRLTAPRDVVPISNLIAEYLEAPRPNIPVGDDLAQMQRTVVSAIESLLKSPEERAQLQRLRQGSRQNSSSSYSDSESGMLFQAEDGSGLAAARLQKYFLDDSQSQGAQK